MLTLSGADQLYQELLHKLTACEPYNPAWAVMLPTQLENLAMIYCIDEAAVAPGPKTSVQPHLYITAVSHLHWPLPMLYHLD